MIADASPDPLLRLDASNRHEIYAELRARSPVHRSAVLPGWVLTRYADVHGVLRHPDALALDVMPFLESLCLRGGLRFDHLLKFCRSLSLLTRQPGHEGVRGMLGHALAGIRSADLAMVLDRRTEELLNAGAARGSMDLAEGYGRTLALFVIGTYLGIPEEDIPRLSALARDFMEVFECTVPSLRTLASLDGNAAALTDYFARLLAARRKEPGRDGISMIVRYADAHMQSSDDELAQNCLFFFIAAEETTSAAISAAALLLLERPGLCARLRSEPTLMKAAALELLRLSSPIQYVARQLAVDIDLHGRQIRAGEPIILMLGAANRDPAAFPAPDEPLLDRSGPKPLTFAAGPYTCLGAQLAAFEVETAIRKLIERRELRLSPASPIWSARMNVAPLQRLEALFASEDS